ncbi:MAG: FliH/SctL family protein [Miltoncostaeaceae bacterium]
MSGSLYALEAREPAPPAPADPADLVGQARAEAEAVLAAARAQAEELRAAALAEGYEQGAAGARAEVAQALEALEEIARSLVARREVMEEEAIDQATRLATEIAAKLIRAEVSLVPERVVDVVRAAIRRASDRERLLVHVHPEDLLICREAAPEIMRSMGGIGALEIIDEPRMDRGSCLVQTPGGDVDASFAGQLHRVLEALSQPPDHDLVGDGADGGAGA